MSGSRKHSLSGGTNASDNNSSNNSLGSAYMSTSIGGGGNSGSQQMFVHGNQMSPMQSAHLHHIHHLSAGNKPSSPVSSVLRQYSNSPVREQETFLNDE